MRKDILTKKRLKELLHYEPTTGLFTRLQVKPGGHVVGSVAGTLSNGYISICVDDKVYQAHRLAHLYMMGTWPVNMIDHRDTDRSNNIWTNLRPATRAENCQNARLRKDNKLGHKNISKDRCTHTVRLKGKLVGCTSDLETAIFWRDFAVEFCYSEFARVV